jgi:hypothetical protein
MFGLVRCRWNPQVSGEAQHIVLPVARAFEQVAAGLLLAAGDAGNLGQASQDAVLERVDQRRRDAVWEGRKARARAVFAAWMSSRRAWVIRMGQCASG